LLCNKTDYFNFDESEYIKSKEIFARFHQGYLKYSTLNKAEKDAFFDLIALYHFALQATIIEIHGIDCVGNAFLDKQLDWLYRWQEQCSNDGNALGRISPLSVEHLPTYAEVIRQSFATISNDFNLTKENCPAHTGFVTDERLASKITEDYYPFGYFVNGKMVGFVSLTDIGDGAFEMKNLSVLPEYRHLGYGKELLNFCKNNIKEIGGNKITLGIIEENTRLKEWYVANGFIHIGTKKYESLPFTCGYMEWVIV
jgi:ribosomal protein S18 acetylase RimI-like enzyme